MVKLFIFSLIAIVLALLVTLFFEFPSDPGYLLIAFGSYTFETSVLAFMVVVGIAYLLFRLISILFQWISPWRWVKFGREFQRQQKAKARSKTLEGLLYFARRNWQSSYKLLTKGSGDPDASVVNQLAAAYAAYELGDKELWMQCLDKAEQDYPSARSTINSLKAQLLFKSNQLEKCLAVLEQMKNNSLNDASLLNLLKDVLIKLEDWDRLRSLLPALEKNSAIDQDEKERIEKRLFMEELYSHSQRINDSSKSQEVIIKALLKSWKKAPGKFKVDGKVVWHYSELLTGLNANQEAALVIESALTKSWSDELVGRYGEQDYGVSPQQLINAESWLKERPANATLLLALGRISMRNQLWGKAKDYYQASIKIAATADAYAELSRLLKYLGEEEGSEKYLQKYRDLIGKHFPELPLPPESAAQPH
jgi:HemY protein